jgi:hypothetical protein
MDSVFPSLFQKSAYLKTHQQEYYGRLTQVRTDGNFEAWIRFFLEGIREVSRMVLQTTKRIYPRKGGFGSAGCPWGRLPRPGVTPRSDEAAGGHGL